MRGRPNHPDGTPREKRHDYWGVVLEAPEPLVVGRFYAGLLGWGLVKENPEHVILAPPDGVAYLAVQRGDVAPVWPAEEGRQRITSHLDFEVADLDAAVAHAIELGGRLAESQPQEDVRVILDPAGHPFCLYVDKSVD
ncbi:glyoxalase [Actinorhabdospora filicis]|uniref:Glyoxalase n=1 Tax=Actinorhabdospora filicis TaxID=1785913 RepID=A0A9W6STL6_9ACTN|nr:VOC family protein [Actinorhabdospora filicis]GLZ81720.1 glyoxalase [Actinorhabdospora filicis]